MSTVEKQMEKRETEKVKKLNACEDVANETKSVYAAETQNLGF